MFLRKLYSEPKGLFDEIIFKDGVNFIFAKKDGPAKKSLNGVGKSLLLNLIDYCLLSSETKHIKSAKDNNSLNNYKVVLEFEVANKFYIIKRSFSDPNKDIDFGIKGENLTSYSNTKKDKKLSHILCDIIFQNPDYVGTYSNKWLRQLIPFFIKSQSSKERVNFKDPIKYLHDSSSELKLIPFHLFLLGINNDLFHQNLLVTQDIKSKDSALKEIKDFVRNSYKLEDTSQAENEIHKLKSQVDLYEKNISAFKLADQYKDTEKNSNEITSRIKELLYHNFSDKNKVSSYESSFQINDEINTNKIKSMYKDLNTLLAGNIKKTLDEAIKFRKNLAKSREEFLQSEIDTIKDSIKSREQEINNLEEERATLFRFLGAKEAIKDLSSAYLELSKKREKLNDLESKTKLHRDMQVELDALEAKSSIIYSDISEFCVNSGDVITKIRNVFFEIHNAIYVNSTDDSGFVFEANKKKDSKVNIGISLSHDLSYGKNKGRTLIYDLTVLFYEIQNKINSPRFLIHDGIFDGMDKAHFVHLYEFLEKKSTEGSKYQYIITLNEDGDLKGDFGNVDKVNYKKIEEEAVITLTPSNKLFKKSWN
ncbi:DUF2326 domain-containing protein [Flavobacteriaceae bacterium]|nr:DUF2326 domain-containing protein [Flavobacteriaceae bacterium]